MNIVSSVTQNNDKRNLFLLVVLFSFFSISGVFAQSSSFAAPSDEVTNAQNNIVIESPVKVSSSVSNSNVNFILWFMGTKEDMGKSFSSDGMYSKKSFMTSGREPNRLLVKTLLKKALNIKSC